MPILDGINKSIWSKNMKVELKVNAAHLLPNVTWYLFFFLSASPLLYLCISYLGPGLGLNPFEKLISVSGQAAMICLLACLSITPLRRWLTWIFRFLPSIKYGRRLSDWNALIRTRKMLGLWSFFYSCVHLWVYFDLELSRSLGEFWYEFHSRELIKYGFVAWLILLLLSLTSFSSVQKKLKRWWRRIHRGVYVAVVLAWVHIFLALKPTDHDTWVYLLAVLVLLGHRVLVQTIRGLKRRDDTGMQVSRRAEGSAP